MHESFRHLPKQRIPNLYLLYFKSYPERKVVKDRSLLVRKSFVQIQCVVHAGLLAQDTNADIVNITGKGTFTGKISY